MSSDQRRVCKHQCPALLNGQPRGAIMASAPPTWCHDDNHPHPQCTHLTRMSACSGASHSRMSAGTMVTVPSHPSATTRFCRVTTALGFFSTAYTLHRGGGGGGMHGAVQGGRREGAAQTRLPQLCVQYDNKCTSAQHLASFFQAQAPPAPCHTPPTAGGAWHGQMRAARQPPAGRGQPPPPSAPSPGYPPPPAGQRGRVTRTHLQGRAACRAQAGHGASSVSRCPSWHYPSCHAWPAHQQLLCNTTRGGQAHLRHAVQQAAVHRLLVRVVPAHRAADMI